MWNEFARLTFIALGLAGIVIGVVGKRFHPGGMGIGDPTTVIPRWFGRVWFALWGSLLFYAGIKGQVPVPVMRIVATVVGASILIPTLIAASKAMSTKQPGHAQTGSGPSLRGLILSLAIGLLFIAAGLLLKR